MLKLPLKKIQSDLAALRGREVILFGSYARGEHTSRSDRDVAVITRISNPQQNVKLWKEVVGKASDNYHINVFELLPLNVKASIMQNYKVVFGDSLEISEYLYHFRKLWNDQRQRYEENQFTSIREKMKALT